MLDNKSREELKIITIVVLVLCACGLTYYFHEVLAQGMIFTHLFYIPVILACVWWKKKGMFVPVFLGSALILSHLFWSTDVPIVNDVLRAVMFVFVGLTVVVLKELLEKEETSRIDTVTESEKKYRLLADNVEDVIWTMDMDLNRVYTSPSVERLRGFTPEELEGLKPEDFATPETLENAFAILAEELELEKQGADPNKSRSFELEQHRKDGSTVWTEVTASFLRDDDGKPIGIIGVGRDINDRRKAEDALRRSEERLQIIAYNVPDVLWTTDLYLNITYASPSIERQTGYTVEESLSMTPGDFMTPDSLEIASQRFVEELKVEQESVSDPPIPVTFEIEIRRKDGTTFWTEFGGGFLRDSNSVPYGILGVTRDISERKEAEEALRRANTKLEGYARTVSHDLKGPLSGILLALDVLGESLDSVSSDTIEEVSETVATLNRNTRNALRRTEELLTLARSGQAPGETSSLDIGGLVDGILEERSGEIKEKGIDVDVSPDMGTITANPTQIYQVFSNLIGNSIRHNDSENPVMRISFLGDDSDEGHRYLVRDNGPGIPGDIIDDVFLPFTRGEGGDSGIGLSIVRKIVETYGGEIKAYNDNGACLEFTIRDINL